MLSLTPLPFGKETCGLFPFPIIKTLWRRVANMCPSASLMCTMSNEPGCLSLLVMMPTRPKLCPPVIMHCFHLNKFSVVKNSGTYHWYKAELRTCFNEISLMAIRFTTTAWMRTVCQSLKQRFCPR
ncbi:hypothetical protein GQR58_011757 [Nymphon striatum]|nr:hypothetical protein GQR58_011757 [Nymphon striatum]